MDDEQKPSLAPPGSWPLSRSERDRELPLKLALARIAACTLLAGCQTFHYTEEDWDREQEQAAAL